MQNAERRIVSAFRETVAGNCTGFFTNLLKSRLGHFTVRPIPFELRVPATLAGSAVARTRAQMTRGQPDAGRAGTCATIFIAGCARHGDCAVFPKGARCRAGHIGANPAQRYPAIAKDLPESMVIQAKAQAPSAAADGKKGHSLISDGKFRQLYELTLLLRTAGNGVRHAASKLHRSEAVLAGVMADLKSDDVVISENASWINEALQSRLPAAMRSPEASKMADLVVESLSSSAANRLRKNERVTVIFGLQTGSDPILKEARALAAAARLPVLFVREVRAGETPRPADNHVSADAMPSIPVDAGDVVAIYRVAHESIARARHGSGPTEIVCSRWRTTGTPRKPGMTGDDPAQRLEQWLTSRGLPAQEWRSAITKAEASAARQSSATLFTANRAGNGADPQPFVQADIQRN